MYVDFTGENISQSNKIYLYNNTAIAGEIYFHIQ